MHMINSHSGKLFFFVEIVSRQHLAGLLSKQKRKRVKTHTMKPPLLIVAGAKGAVGSTVAAAVADLRNKGNHVTSWLTTAGWIDDKILTAIAFAGWDDTDKSMTETLTHQAVLSHDQIRLHAAILDEMMICRPPSLNQFLREQVLQVASDMRFFLRDYPEHQPVFINLLPASEVHDLQRYRSLNQFYRQFNLPSFPDPAYVLAALENGIPIVNFTSNALEAPVLIREAKNCGIPWCGRDGKTGQTYLKVVIASALKARHLFVDGWYSLNILGNEDGRNLADPRRASGKLANKTHFLDTILGYPVGERYGQSTHKVAIDYYPPRGDCKEAWDAIDFTGVFGMPMSLRLNMQLRDSILAAPMVIDLACWMSALREIGHAGLVPQLAFYFKKAPTTNYPVTFQEQVKALDDLEMHIRKKTGARKSAGE